MSLQQGFEPHLVVGDIAVTGRDIDMLRAIDETGSMHKAAEDLGRSYSHLQRRVTELEDEIGTLTRRNRGGKAGGGTDLTPEGRDILHQFDRLRVALRGVTMVEETVIPGTVIDRDGDLVTVRTAAGDLSARAPVAGEAVEIALRADAVVLLHPGSPSQVHTSMRNQIRGTVSEITEEAQVATVAISIADSLELTAIVTTESVSRLNLNKGREIVAAFKTTAARAVPVEF